MDSRLGSGRRCELRLVRVAFLRHYYVFHFPAGEPTGAEASEMFLIASVIPGRLAKAWICAVPAGKNALQALGWRGRTRRLAAAAS